MDKKHIEQIYKWYCDYENVENHVKVASLDDIKENDFNLNISLYVEKNIDDNLPSVKEALKSLKKAFEGAVKAEDKMKEKLKEFELL